MNSLTPRITAWVFLIIAIPLLVGLFFLFMLSGWALCGDTVDCDPSAGAIIQVGLLDLGLLITAIAIILPAVYNFKFAKLLTINSQIETPKSYYVVTYGNILIYLLTILYLLMSRVLGDGFIFVIIGLAVILFFVSLFYFLKIRKEINSNQN